MTQMSPREVWNVICALAEAAVEDVNRQEGLRLTFYKSPHTDTFSISRQTPYLIVEPAFSLGQISYTSMQWGSKNVPMPGLGETLRITCDGQLTQGDKSMSREEFVQGILKCFRDCTGRYTSKTSLPWRTPDAAELQG